MRRLSRKRAFLLRMMNLTRNISLQYQNKHHGGNAEKGGAKQYQNKHHGGNAEKGGAKEAEALMNLYIYAPPEDLEEGQAHALARRGDAEACFSFGCVCDYFEAPDRVPA